MKGALRPGARPYVVTVRDRSVCLGHGTRVASLLGLAQLDKQTIIR